MNIGATVVLTDCGDGSLRGFTTSTHINGVGVYNEGTFTMYAGTISDIISNGNGGGVYNEGTFTLYGGTIRNNELTEGTWYGRGAGVYQKAGSFTMYGGTITDNKAVLYGGGVYYSGGTFTMHGGTIGENCADSGGGVYGNYFAMYGGSVINNTATSDGGGIRNYNGTLELSGNVTITGNEVNEEQSDIYIGYTVITIKEDFAPTSAIGVTKCDVIGTIVRAAEGETLDIEDYEQYFVGEGGIPFYVAGDALELGYTVIEEPDDTNNHTVKTNSDANASYQWAKYGLIAHSVVYESYGPMSLRSVTPMPGMEDAFGVEAALVNDCGYWGDDYWDYYPNYDAENKYWIASNNVVDDGDARECYHKFDASYFIIIPKKNGTLSVTLIDPLDNGEELALYIMGGEGFGWLVEEVTPNADGSYSMTAGLPYRLLIKDSDDTNNGTYEYGFNDTFPKLTATFTAMGASELLDGQNEATLDMTGLGSGAYVCKTSWDIYDTPADAEDDYYLVSAPVTRYGVIFDYGTLGSETKTVSSGETVTPPAPVFAGKVLVGWYTDSSFATEFNFSDAITADNTTIYAKFTAAVAKIEKIGTSGLVDTYTITYTDGTTATFTVTNGEKGDKGDQGIQGIQGVPGADGHTPIITIQNGYWYIDGVNTNQAAQGFKGDTGAQGPQGEKGDKGDTGAQGEKGDKGNTGAAGADGVGIAKIEKTSSDGNVDTYTITLTNGTTYTFTVTNGTNGTDGKDGVDGKDGTNGTNGVDGKDGANGTDGQTPYIGENGNWWIGDTDTGVKAAGDDGKDGAIIVATAVGGTALISNIALIAWTLIKKKRLF